MLSVLVFYLTKIKKIKQSTKLSTKKKEQTFSLPLLQNNDNKPAVRKLVKQIYPKLILLPKIRSILFYQLTLYP